MSIIFFYSTNFKNSNINTRQDWTERRVAVVVHSSVNSSRVLSLRTEDEEEEEEDRYVRCDAPLLLEPVQRNAFSITTRCDAMRCAVLCCLFQDFILPSSSLLFPPAVCSSHSFFPSFLLLQPTKRGGRGGEILLKLHYIMHRRLPPPSPPQQQQPNPTRKALKKKCKRRKRRRLSHLSNDKSASPPFALMILPSSSSRVHSSYVRSEKQFFLSGCVVLTDEMIIVITSS